jgi:hypothetical protein
LGKGAIMLEILVVIILCRRLGEKARQKGRTAGWYMLMLVGMWVFGELLGGVVGILLSDGQVTATAYVAALIGAALGAVGAFLIVGALTPLYPQPQFTGGFPVMQNPGSPYQAPMAPPPPGGNDPRRY